MYSKGIQKGIDVMQYEVKKEGSMLLFTVIDDSTEPVNKKTFKFDFKTLKTYNYTGRVVRHFPVELMKYKDEFHHWGELITFETWEQYVRGVIPIDKMYKLERWLPLVDRLTYSCRDLTLLPDSIPKGFTEWLGDKCIGSDTFKDFKREYAMQNTWNKDDREMYDTMLSFLSPTKVSEVYFTIPDENRHDFTKVLKNSFKHFYRNFERLLEGFFDYLRRTEDYYSDHDGKARMANWYEYLNPERDIEWNYNNLINLSNKERNDKVVAFQSIFKEIEKLSTDKLVIVVPTSIEQFNDESKQQNNCVSYYYHKSIAEHDNMIYFIRRAENVRHSYITNRFNFYDKETCESRAVNNRDYTNNDVTELIKAIDEKIKEIYENMDKDDNDN